MIARPRREASAFLDQYRSNIHKCCAGNAARSSPSPWHIQPQLNGWKPQARKCFPGTPFIRRMTAPFSEKPAYTTIFGALDISSVAMSGSVTKKSASQTFFSTHLTAAECQAHLGLEAVAGRQALLDRKSRNIRSRPRPRKFRSRRA